MTTFRLAFLLSVFVPGALADEPKPKPAITIRLNRPDQQARAIIDLFEGAKVPHPAAALAGWKRASKEPNRLGKPLEALITSINPGMIRELGTVHDAEADLWFRPEDGKLDWGAFLPNDDGTFAALATSMVLSGGSAEGRMNGLAVDRLGSPGAALMARGNRALLLGGSREGLKEALTRSERPHDPPSFDGLRFTVDPEALVGAKSLAIQRLRVLLGDPLGQISGQVGLVRSSLVASAVVSGKKPAIVATVETEWVEWVPAGRAMAAFALAIDPKAENWDAVFELADKVERLDPIRQNVAPSRLRLDLLARTLGVRADADILSHLRGISGWVGSDGKEINGAFLMLHLDEEAPATRVYEWAKPIQSNKPILEPRAGQGRWLGKVDGRDLRLFRVGKAVVVCWGEGVMEASLGARDHPNRSAGEVLRQDWTDSKPSFAGGLWPSRVPGLLPEGSSLDIAVSDSPPVTWMGFWNDPAQITLQAAWKDLDLTVNRFLALIPLDPPPDR